MYYGSSKSAKILLSKPIFYVKKSTEFFQKQNSFKNINLGDHFLKKKPIFLTSIFEQIHRDAFCQFPFWCIYYYGRNKSTGKATGKMHLVHFIF